MTEWHVQADNDKLATQSTEIDGLLAAALGVDAYVDLEGLKIAAVQHPPFDPGPLATPARFPSQPFYVAQPVYQEPPAPAGFGSVFGARKKHREATTRARVQFESAYQQWQDQANRQYAEFVAAGQQREAAETDRSEKLAVAQAVYDQECRDRQAQAVERNAAVDKLITDFAFDVESAINDYVGLVLVRSGYPTSFRVTHSHAFHLSTRELDVTVDIPAPTTMPTVKAYRYNKTTEQITAIPLTAKAQKDRYAGAVWQVAVRTIHEVFQADRTGKIRTIALTVTTHGVNPATGLQQSVALVIAAADRDTFGQFDLANVVPHAILTHLGAALSKSPFDLTPADAGRGVRARGR